MKPNTDPARTLAQVERDLALARRRIPGAIAALSATTPTGWPASSRPADGSNGTDVARPTENAALAGLRQRALYSEITELVMFVHQKMKQLVDIVADVAVDTDVSKEAERIRCSGGEGEWADLTCTRNSVRTMASEVSGQRIPVCWACLGRRRRWRMTRV